jgi:hypothetical protein
MFYLVKENYLDSFYKNYEWYKFKSCGSYFYLMINLVKEDLEDRICAYYKKVLDLLQKEKPILA